jgi:hypothetical protein
MASLSAAPALRFVDVAHAADPAIETALGQYNEAKFIEAIATLRAAMSGGALRGQDLVLAKELLARCLVKAGERLEAKEAFKSVLRQDKGYRPDPNTVAPDELEVFNMALREIQSEQIEAGSRVPASLSFLIGTGSGKNDDLAAMPKAGGGPDEYESQTEFGGSVRFPIKERLSLEIEMQRFRATASDSFPENNGGRYEASALPISISVFYAAIARTKWRVNVFGGGGPLFSATSTIKFRFTTDRVALADEKVGLYGHAGIEGEYLLHPRVAVTARVLGRMAKASGLYKDVDPSLELYGTTKLTDRELNFSGYGAHVGLRAYIGY